MLQEPNYIQEISESLQLKNFQIEIVLELIAEGATVPFIARYRKEQTGNLDEDNIRDITALKTKLENIYEAKKTAINGIEELGKMTDELMENILKAKTLKEVEEIYKPYKSKKKTKAMIAIENGFQIVADAIKQNQQVSKNDDFLADLLKDFSFEEIIEGVIEIIGAEVSANADLRADLIETLEKYGEIVSKYKTEKSLEKLNEKDKAQIPKFDLYKDFHQKISWLKPYQILALNRGEKLGILNIKIEKTDKTYEGLRFHYARILETKSPFTEELEAGFKKGYEALFSSVENELRANLGDLGEDDAIETFKENLAKLLMTKPEYGNKILAIDPGFRAGCKITILDDLANPLVFDKIYLHKETEAKVKLENLIKKYTPNVIVIGNGTGVNETIDILKELTKIDIYIVNESGASVYSASKIAQEEFPDLDSLDRGTISIARRFVDPLSELVKVPVGSIGVGLYQHDVAPKKLEEKLTNVVEDVVNEIGINVNTASSYVLNYISGIDKRLAKKIYKNRPYKSRNDLQKQMNEKTYEQAIGFLRIPESSEKFDNTDIHPEQYELAKFIIEKNPIPLKGTSLNKGRHNEVAPGGNVEERDKGGISTFFDEHKQELTNIYPNVNENTIEFIISSFENAGEEKRKISTHKKVNTSLKKEDIKEGSVIDGTVKNVVAFGAFVDIGLKNDGLVHISEIANEFVSDPKDFLEVGQDVKVKITKIDEGSGKIQLSMKEV